MKLMFPARAKGLSAHLFPLAYPSLTRVFLLGLVFGRVLFKFM